VKQNITIAELGLMKMVKHPAFDKALSQAGVFAKKVKHQQYITQIADLRL
jgi:hypothetical protein